MVTAVHRRKRRQRTRESQNWTMEDWEKLAWSDDDHVFFYIMRTTRCVCFVYLRRQQDALSNVLLGNLLASMLDVTLT